MPIKVVCPTCNAPYTLGDALAGKRVKCKQCPGVIAVPLRDEDLPELQPMVEDEPKLRQGVRVDRPPPRRRVELEDETESTRPKKRRAMVEEDKKPSLLVPAALIGGGVLLMAGLIAAAVFLVGGKKAAPNIVADAGPVPTSPAAPPTVQRPAEPIMPGNPVLPPNKPVGLAVWKVVADPAPAELRLENVPPLQLPFEIGNDVLFPTTTSPFVVIGRNILDADSRTLYDLRTGKAVGGLRGKLHGFSNVALSPDGQYIAAVDPANLRTVDVWSLIEGKGVSRIDVNQTGFMHGMDFGPPGQIVTVVTGAGFKHVVQIWDLKTGQRVREIAGTKSLGSGDGYSPGRRYLARFADKWIQVFDLTNGDISELDLPGEGFSTCQALAFSPDGTMLAGYFQGAGDSRIVVVDVAKGQITATHAFPQPLNLMVPNAFGHTSAPLQWLPDNSGWLAYGDTVIDRVSGKAGFSLSSQVKEMARGPRRIVSRSQMLIVEGRGANMSLRTVQINAKGVVGGEPNPAGENNRPAAKPGDWSTARTLRPGTGGNWAGPIDPLGTLRGKPALPIAIGGNGAAPISLLFTKPESAQVVVIGGAAAKNKFNPRTWRADRYDLIDGKLLGSVDVIASIPQTLSVAGFGFAEVSPDGTRLVVRDIQDPGRLDVVSLTEGKLLVAWWPYAQAAKDPSPGSRVVWAEFGDESHLWTMAGDGKLALWSVPEAKAIVTIDAAANGAPTRSPGGKQLAAFAGGAMELFDAVTGESRGRLESPTGGLAQSAAVAGFRPDGKELAALLHGIDAAGRATLVRWDLVTGKVVGEFPLAIQHSPESGLEWCGPNHVLVGGTELIDLSAKQVFYRYAGSTRRAQRSPDGRNWYVRSNTLAARTLPSPAAVQIGASLKSAEPVLVSGGTVGMRLDATGTLPELEDMRKQMTDTLTSRLKLAGLTVGGAGPQLAVQLRESETGRALDLELFGGIGPRRVLKIPVKKLTCQATLTDPRGGGVLWTSNATFTTQDFFGIRRFKGEPAAEIHKSLWDVGAGWVSSLAIPTNIVRVNGKAVVLPIAEVPTARP